MGERLKEKGDYEKMMKKLAVVILSVALAANLVACGCGAANGNGAVEESTVQETTDGAENEQQEETQPAEENTEESAENSEEAVSGETLGYMLVEEFHAVKAENAEITAQEMADTILANPMIQFEGATMPVEAGLLTGFGNVEITGFKEGVMFAPMIGSIPFVGYVFALEDGTDVDAFMQVLKDNADPRWNICTEAEETVIEKADNMVFFVMCPSQFE